MRKTAIMVVLGWVAMAMAGARGGTLLLNDGRSFEGNVQVIAMGSGVEGKVSVLPAGKTQVIATLSDVKLAVLTPRVGGDTQSKECDGVRWQKTELGNSQKAGHVDINGSKITIADSSEGFRIGKHPHDASAMTTPSCCFVFQKLEGNGEIVAKVILGTEGPRTTRAGLMICEGIDGTGKLALISRTPDVSGATLLSRVQRGEAITSVGGNPQAVSTWLKLVRRANPTKNEPEIEAFESANGLQWTPVGQLKRLVMDEKAGIYIGVAATGNLREGQATFENIRLTGKRSEADAPGIVDTRLPDAYTMLADGTLLCTVVDSLKDGEAKLKMPASLGGQSTGVAVGKILRTQFGPLTRGQAERLAGAGAGVLTKDGDFLDGEIKDLKPAAVTVSSVAFGLTTMERNRVTAVAFSPPANAEVAPGLYEVRLQDGSVVVAKKLAIDKEQLVMDEPVLGELKVGIKDVVSFEKRGS